MYSYKMTMKKGVITTRVAKKVGGKFVSIHESVGVITRRNASK